MFIRVSAQRWNGTPPPSGAPLLYNKTQANYRNGAFVAWGDPASAAMT
jgi:hypothetical protein